MTSFIVAPTEPAALKALAEEGGAISLLPERHGCDVAWYVKGQLWGVQRKEVKDFIASVQDGRLWKEIIQMTTSQIPMPLVLVEGKVQFDNQGNLMNYSYGKPIKDTQWLGMLWSVRQRGVHIDFTSSAVDTAKYISTLARWSEKGAHDSLARRVGARSPWGSVTNEDYGVHLLQSFDGVGVDKARAIYRHFGGVPLEWTVDAKELTRVAGVGKVLAERLIKAMEKVATDE